jgi:hypothetical protein
MHTPYYEHLNAKAERSQRNAKEKQGMANFVLKKPSFAASAAEVAATKLDFPLRFFASSPPLR